MSECTHDCSTCGESCSEREQDLTAKLNPASSVKKVIAVVSGKGGVGKTTTSVSLSAALALKKKKVLLIDCDPQGNATSGLGIDKTELSSSIYNVLIERMPLRNIVLTATQRNCSCRRNGVPFTLPSTTVRHGCVRSCVAKTLGSCLSTVALMVVQAIR